MLEGMQRLEAMAAEGRLRTDDAPTLDALAAIDALDYLDFRFTDAPWLPAMPALRDLGAALAQRPSVQRTRPH